MSQIAVRVSDRLVGELDELVTSGRFETRADAIRAAIQALIDAERRRRTDAAIVEGYRLHPSGDDPELEAALDAEMRRTLAARDLGGSADGTWW